ncbi:hypothetical protein HDU87_006739 [Geranomyces variabilis]|uniref:ER membrane protein complex subunit 10 n=1 Tax=Geranomyces variabilis TaxID=109894 RepID=A0AAD5TUM1_9FUNG|nr:hypothetical protein HDU87_006739 [Geranomyces variabilis]
MKLPSALVFTVLLAVGFLHCAAEPMELSVLHSLGSSAPSLRGSIVYDPASLKRSANKYVAGSATAGSVVSAGANTDPREMYRVYVEGDGVKLTAAVPLCMLEASEYQEQITLHLDSNGVPWHLDYLVGATSCEKPAKPLGRTPKTLVFIERALAGTRPKLEQMVETTVDGKPEPEKSFIQKYWFYIVPAVLILLLQSGGEEPAKK